MEKEDKKMVLIKEIDGVPYINWTTAKMIEKKDLVFVWKSQFFKIRRIGLHSRRSCWECKLDSICDADVRSICDAFNRHLEGCHRLVLAQIHV